MARLNLSLSIVSGLADFVDQVADVARNGFDSSSIAPDELAALTAAISGFFASDEKGDAGDGIDLNVDNLVNATLARMAISEIDGVSYITIDATVASAADSAAALDALETMGLAYGSTYNNVVSGLIPVTSLADLETTDILFDVRATSIGTNVGSVTTQSDFALQADVARADLAVDGSGVSIGILSDSFDTSPTALTTFADDVASGDLPADVTIIEDFNSGGTIDEGRAMAQLIHDIAPGADLLFATAFTGAAGFANNIDRLVDEGADIIVDDIIYFFEPMFQDGVIAQAAANAVEEGVSFFSSAGNNGIAGYEAPFRATTDTALELIVPFAGGATFHDWDPGAGVDTTLDITIPAGFLISDWFLQWSEPFLSGALTAAGTGPDGLSAGSGVDLDIWLLDAAGNVITGSADANFGGDPTEQLFVDNFTTEAIEAQVVISKFLDFGGDPDVIRIVGFGAPNDDFVTGFDLVNSASFSDLSEFRAGTTYGHAVAEGVLGVGASPWFFTPEFGAVDGPVPEDFSALGGSTILFDADGNRLATPDVRDAVDFTASNGGETTFFGQFLGDLPGLLFPGGVAPDNPPTPNFFGTSAAAPNAAAVAALLLEADPSLTPAEIEATLEATAIDMVAPFTLTSGIPFTEGFQEQRSVGVAVGDDARTGAGLIQADAAVAAVNDANPTAVDDMAATDYCDPVTVDAFENDAPGGALRAVNTAGLAGALVSNGDGTFEYDPNGQFAYLAAGETAIDAFTYTVDGADGSVDTATVEITVEGVSDDFNQGTAFSFSQGTNGGSNRFGFDGDSFFISGQGVGGRPRFDDFDDFLQAAAGVFDGVVERSGDINDQRLDTGDGPNNIRVNDNDEVIIGGSGIGGSYRIQFENTSEAETFATFVERMFDEVDANNAIATDPEDFRFDAGDVRVFFDKAGKDFGFTTDGGATQSRFEDIETFVESLMAALGAEEQLRDGSFNDARIAGGAVPNQIRANDDGVLTISGRSVGGRFQFDFGDAEEADVAVAALQTLFAAIDEADALADPSLGIGAAPPAATAQRVDLDAVLPFRFFDVGAYPQAPAEDPSPFEPEAVGIGLDEKGQTLPLFLPDVF
ncbi:MAG: S8 family serine peptidase [Pseudomonadota bacterium]